MVAKFVAILMVVGGCLTFPVEDESRPHLPETTLIPRPEGPAHPVVINPESQQAPELVKPEGTDLKTDNSYWWRRSYYPSWSSRSYYYRPRTYSTYYEYYPYSYWNSYW